MKFIVFGIGFALLKFVILKVTTWMRVATLIQMVSSALLIVKVEDFCFVGVERFGPSLF